MDTDAFRNDLHARIKDHLGMVYGDIDHSAWAQKLIDLMNYPRDLPPVSAHQNHWDQADIALITYGDSVVSENEKPLTTLKKILDTELRDQISIVHILPFFPYSSDDGFSIMDYLSVNSALGDWQHISAIAKDYRLMSDLVINHGSARSRWFENFKKGLSPGKNYFFCVAEDADIEQVVRPRSSKLLNPVETEEGTRWVWCTFSQDQVDFNFANPAVLAEFVNIICHYMEWGVEIFRLDAVAFLWKQPGSSCLHLPQTHEIIKILRLLIEHKNPRALVITETNVPNRENITYLGNANEAHVIYNFSLPPLLLNALITGDCTHLKTWMMSMPPAQNGTAYLNFIASHDGIGLRPVEGLMTEDEVNLLIATMQKFGGMVSFRKGAEGFEKPYEINISLYDAMKGTADHGVDEWQCQRFICAHSIMLALEGIPAFYIHSLLGTENDTEKFDNTRRKRAINRHTWQLEELNAKLADSQYHHRPLLRELKRLIAIRKRQPAFHPNVTQFTLHLGEKVFAFWRQSLRRDQSIFCISNITAEPRSVPLAEINLIDTHSWCDLIGGLHYDDLRASLELQPYQTVWLSNCRY
jgi:sucrose phosphorylase